VCPLATYNLIAPLYLKLINTHSIIVFSRSFSLRMDTFSIINELLIKISRNPTPDSPLMLGPTAVDLRLLRYWQRDAVWPLQYEYFVGLLVA
jgi:hypothetical protein